MGHVTQATPFMCKIFICRQRASRTV